LSAGGSELTLEGKIFYVEKDDKGVVTEKSEIDGQLCLKVLVYLLDDAVKKPVMHELLDDQLKLALE